MQNDLIKTLEGLDKKEAWIHVDVVNYSNLLPEIISALKDLERMREALEYAKRKREFKGTAKMIMRQMERALNEIADKAKEALEHPIATADKKE